MAENRAEPEQADFISDEDDRAALRRWFRLAAERVGYDQLAHALDMDPSTLRNQTRWRVRPEGGYWQPNADTVFEVFLRDARFREQSVGLRGEVLSKPPDLTPSDALREIAVRAQGGWDRRAMAEVNEILARVKP